MKIAKATEKLGRRELSGLADISSLFETCALGHLSLPNRMVMAPMTRARASQPKNIPTDLNALYYAQRASAGLIVTESAYISEVGRGYGGTPGIHTLEQVDGWRIVTSAVHASGGRIYCQLWHAGRVSHVSLQPERAEPVAPSTMTARNTQVFTITPFGKLCFLACSAPRALRTIEVHRIIEDFRAASRLAMLAGFDGVEIHGANGFLIDQFLRSTTNLRTDEYGGKPEKRTRLLDDVVSAVAGEIGPENIGVRLSPHISLKDMYDPEILPTIILACEKLHRRSIGYIHFAEAEWEDAAKVDIAFRHEIRRRFGGVIIVSGGLDAAAGARILNSGFVDLIAYGRLFLSNPDLPRRFRAASTLNLLDRSTLYGGGAAGYTDYPLLELG